MSKFVLAAALAVATLSSQAFAADLADPPVQSVSAANVNFRDAAAVEAFYTQLARAADAVCDSYAARSRVTEADRACASKALNNAVRAADKPLLTAMHKGGHVERVYAARTDR